MHPDKPIPYRMVVAPARVGEFAEQNLRSGDKVEVTGQLSIFKKEDETGVLKERYELNANWIELLEEAPEEQNLFNPALTQEDIQDLSEEAVEEADETLSAQLYNDED